MNFSRENTPFYVKFCLVLLAIIALGYLIVMGKEVLCPLLFGLLFSILLLPLARFFEKKWKFSRGAASALTVLLLLIAIAGLAALIGSQLTSLAQDWPQFKAQLMESLHNLQDWISRKFHVDLTRQMEYLNKATSRITAQTTSMIGATVISVSSILLFFIFILIDTFFMLFYRRLFLRFIIAVFSEENKNIVMDITENIQFIIRKYLIGLLLEMSIVATVCCLAFLIIGIKYAILLGLLTGLFNLIPYIGIYTALALNLLITFATAATSAKILLVVITVVSMHMIDSNILLPVIVGSKVRINAFITLFGVVVGEMIWGISGMFLSIPTIAITKIIFDRIESLKPWGMLLGHDESVEKHREINLKRRNKLRF